MAKKYPAVLVITDRKSGLEAIRLLEEAEVEVEISCQEKSPKIADVEIRASSGTYEGLERVRYFIAYVKRVEDSMRC